VQRRRPLSLYGLNNMEKKSKCPNGESCQIKGCGYCNKTASELFSTPTTDEGKEQKYSYEEMVDFDGLVPTPPESWEEEFERLFLGGNFGIIEHIKHNNLNSFISQILATEKAKWMKETREKIELWKVEELNSQRHSGRVEGYNQALDDIIKLIKDDGTSN